MLNVLFMFYLFGFMVGILFLFLFGVCIFLYLLFLYYWIVSEVVYDMNVIIMFGIDMFFRGYVCVVYGYDFYFVCYVFVGVECVCFDMCKIWVEKFGV